MNALLIWSHTVDGYIHMRIQRIIYECYDRG